MNNIQKQLNQIMDNIKKSNNIEKNQSFLQTTLKFLFDSLNNIKDPILKTQLQELIKKI